MLQKVNRVCLTCGRVNAFKAVLLFPVQALLLAPRRYSRHLALWRLSLGLAAVMIVTGLFVLSVRMDDALADDGGPGFLEFLRQVGPMILVSLLLFAIFYAAAIRAALTGCLSGIA